jgi:2-polyprenyl-3-methyl-5-hydroxy-6-metoxy-1,4-benzoquinol methylase
MPSAADKSSNRPDYGAHYAAVNNLGDATYASTAAWYGRLLEAILPTIPRSASILDVGCGAGLLVHALRQAGFTNVAGVDPTVSLVQVAAGRGLPCRQVPEDFVEQAGGGPDGEHDVIFLLDVLEHIPVDRQLAFLRGLRRLLRPGGRLVLSVPNGSSTVAARWRYIDWTHTSAFTEHSLRYVLLSTGFDAPKLYPHEFFPRPRLPLLVRPGVLRWWLHRCFRMLRRLEVVAELGPQGWAIPLSVNLLAVAENPAVAPPSDPEPREAQRG